MGNQTYYTDLRVAVTHRGYLKLGYRTYPNDLGNDLRQYQILAGFMTTPKQGGNSTRGYMEFGAGYDKVKASQQFVIAAQGGVLIPFGRDSNIGLDLGLSFVGNYFDSDEENGFILGAQVGLLLMFGRNP